MASGDDDVVPESTEHEIQDTTSYSESEDELSKPYQALQRRLKKPLGREPVKEVIEGMQNTSKDNVAIEVRVPFPERPWEYQRIPEDAAVDRVLEEVHRSGNELWYKIGFEDGVEEEVSFDKLLTLRKGPTSLEVYNKGGKEDGALSEVDQRLRDHSSGRSAMSSGGGKRTRTRGRSKTLGIVSGAWFGSEDEDLLTSTTKRRRVNKPRILPSSMKTSSRNNTVNGHPISTLSPEDESSEDELRPTRSQRSRSNRGIQPTRGSYANNGRITRSSGARPPQRPNYSDAAPVAEEAGESEEIDELAAEGYESNDEIKLRLRLRSNRGRGRGPRRTYTNGMRRTRTGRNLAASSSDERPQPTRRSGRTTRATNSMKERMEDEETFADDVVSEKGPQIISIREVFQPLPARSHFRVIHNQNCDVCGGHDSHSNKGTSPLIYCQGCSTSIHKACLGYRSGREHMVTKIGEQNFVMQCRRCIGIATKKDFTAPCLDMCQICKKPGDACEAFSGKKTPKQEEKLREENGGNDPITTVDSELINNAAIVLFRCIGCHRGFHFEHLQPQNSSLAETETVEHTRDLRFSEYSQSWQCKTCLDAPAKVQGLVAWRPANVNNYTPGQTIDMVNEDDKEYLVKWEGLSHFRCTWMPGAWVWGVTATTTRTAFARRDEGANSFPKMHKEDAIPEEFLRMEIVLDVKYSSRVKTHTAEIDKARVKEVEEVYVKFQGLGYEDVVWERPPSPNETERWADFVASYNEYIVGKYFKQPHAKMKERLQEYRALDFKKKVLINEQPASLTGGKIMPYQLEGLNWLLYNFHQEKNVVLADEMGLGKTIQVIAALATLAMEKPKCCPFLVVVPNSTCPNWRREIKKWAPSLRVVAYYGLRKARDVAMKYELFPDGCSDMRAHVVVTSYDAPVDDHSRAFFQKIKWVGMIVDEGQRLKNDRNLLYGALSALKVPFRVLLTGTPLQNNKRELFNLLQFLDSSMNAAKLDEEYAELTNDNLLELHELIRPYFLRRTKAQVLKFLPPMAQVIVPVSMTVVQKKLYKSILAKSPDLIRSIFVKDQTQLRPNERGSLNNILMQLRKVLCHPFIYSEAVEERSASQTVSHRNLVDAASKLQLLEIMLPKLQERGHRVLIFSQFLKQLDIIEDFLDGLGLFFQRLDGNVGSLEKQKRIDAYNAPDSPLFAFLLSTRAGGVGINLATADTVIIMDPDFNPHQDIQALSRAHRIGQKKKVLVFQLMTKDSAEEKIVQIGRKKMALDHALIESMDADDDAGVDLQSILQHGAQALFDDNDQNDIKYDSASVDKLLDRSQVEDTNVGDDKSAESQFSYARIWANDKGTLTDDVGDADSDVSATNPSVWDKILKQREADAAREAAQQQKLFGRGKRMRQTVDYHASNMGLDDDILGPTPEKPTLPRRTDRGSDTDFAMAAESGPDEDSEVPDPSAIDPRELEMHRGGRGGISADSQQVSEVRQVDSFRRAKIPRPVPYQSSVEGSQAEQGSSPIRQEAIQPRHCHACGAIHIAGYCSLKRTGVDLCGLCGLAHFGGLGTCPHLKSETQVRLMLDALKTSTESRQDIELARTQLRRRIHHLINEKKKKRASLA